MKLATVLSAIALPALAVAQEESDSTTTCTSTTTVTQTVTITNLSATSAEPTVSGTGADSAPPAESTGDAEEPTGGAAALDAARIAFAGVAGMVIVAFM